MNGWLRPWVLLSAGWSTLLSALGWSLLSEAQHVSNADIVTALRRDYPSQFANLTKPNAEGHRQKEFPLRYLTPDPGAAEDTSSDRDLFADDPEVRVEVLQELRRLGVPTSELADVVSAIQAIEVNRRSQVDRRAALWGVPIVASLLIGFAVGWAIRGRREHS
jgi:hypothetical protein